MAMADSLGADILTKMEQILRRISGIEIELCLLRSRLEQPSQTATSSNCGASSHLPGSKPMKGDDETLADLVFLAAENGHHQALRVLKRFGADLSAPSVDGATPAIIAAENGHTDVLAFLGEEGVDLNVAMDGGATAAFIAACNGKAQVI